jgi:hypothetical protein
MRTMKTAVLTLAGVLLASLLGAQTPRGAEIKVNNLQASSYGPAQVAAAPNGGFVVVWQTGYLGDPPVPPVEKPVVWVRLFRADGTPKTNQLRVNPGSSPQVLPRVALGADGSFVVVWEDILPTSRTVSGRLFDAEGRPRGRRFRLSSTPVEVASYLDLKPAVALAADGSFVAAWTGAGVLARRFDAAGQPLGPEFRANVTTYDERSAPQVAMSASGDFVIGWVSYVGESAFRDIYARRFAKDGTPQSDEFRVNSGENAVGNQDEFALGAAKNGSFVGLWTDEPDIPPLPNGFFGQRFAAGGEPLGQPFEISSSSSTFRAQPAIAVAADGSFFAVWSSYVSVTGPQRYSIVGRRFASDGTPFGGDLRIDRSAAGPKGGPSVALGGDGRGLVVWAQDDGIVARRLVP